MPVFGGSSCRSVDNVLPRLCKEFLSPSVSAENILDSLAACPQRNREVPAEHEKFFMVNRSGLNVFPTGFLKRLSVTELGFVTQGCLAMHVAKGPGPVYMGNLALKINVKVCGSATRLKQSPAACCSFV
jgi:hypothetical protein